MVDIDYIIGELLDTPYAKRQSDEYVYVRCPFCGDSQKHHDKPHCSIWIKDGQPLIYHCWICESSGIVNNAFLQDLNLNNVELLNKVSNYNTANIRGGKPSQYVTSNITKDLLIPEIKDTEISEKKIKYITERIRVNFTPKSLEYLNTKDKIEYEVLLNLRLKDS